MGHWKVNVAVPKFPYRTPRSSNNLVHALAQALIESCAAEYYSQQAARVDEIDACPKPTPIQPLLITRRLCCFEPLALNRSIHSTRLHSSYQNRRLSLLLFMLWIFSSLYALYFRKPVVNTRYASFLQDFLAAPRFSFWLIHFV